MNKYIIAAGFLFGVMAMISSASSTVSSTLYETSKHNVELVKAVSSLRR